jgi:hypothetical protein
MELNGPMLLLLAVCCGGLLYQGRGGGWFSLGRGGFGCSFQLPLESTCPVLFLLRVKLGFPSCCRFLAGGTGMTFGVAADAVAVRNVVVQLLLEFAGNGLTFEGSVQVWSL